MYKIVFTFVTLSMACSAAADVGFRELVPGADFNIVDRNCFGRKCYGIDDLTFYINKEEIQSESKVCSWRNDGAQSAWAKGGVVYLGLTCNGLVPKPEDMGGYEFIDDYKYRSGWLSSASDSEICQWAVICKPAQVRYVIGDIIVDLGPLYQNFLDLVMENKQNPYVALRKNMEERYLGGNTERICLSARPWAGRVSLVISADKAGLM